MKKNKIIFTKLGFTLIEMLIVLGIIVVLALAVLYGIRPVERIKDARDSKRVVHSQALWKAITQKIYEDGGSWKGLLPLPSVINQEVGPVFKLIANDPSIPEEDQFDLCSEVWPSFIEPFPVDPLTGWITDENNPCAEYNSRYELWKNPNNEEVLIRAADSEIRLIGVNLDSAGVGSTGGIVATVVGEDSILLNWDAINEQEARNDEDYFAKLISTMEVEAEQQFIPVRYEIYRGTAPDPTTKVGEVDGYTTEWLDDNNGTGLDTDIDYYYQIVTVTTAGAGLPSNNYIAAIPSSLAMPTAVVVNGNGLQVTWGTHPYNGELRGDSYIEVYRGTTPPNPHTGTPFYTTSSLDVTAIQDFEVDFDQDYYYSIKAVAIPGENPYTSHRLAAVASGTSIATFSVTDTDNIDLTWGASTYNGDLPVVYEIYRGTSSNPTNLVHTTGSTSWSNSGLNTNTDYYYRIQAIATPGEILYSDNAIAAIVTPPGITATPHTSGTMRLTLSPPGYSGALPVQYKIYRDTTTNPTTLIHTTSSTTWDNAVSNNQQYYYRAKSSVNLVQGDSPTYSATTINSVVNFAFSATHSGNSGTIQTYAVPGTGIYRIDAYGAQGGPSNSCGVGGLGAHMRGDFSLTVGNSLKILVGQMGLQNTNFSQGGQIAGGGGGTFVTHANNTILLVAGGGGGSWYYTGSGCSYGLNAVTTTNGTNGAGGRAGGVNGGAGSYSNCQGGAGWNTSATNACSQTIAYRFIEGGVGGTQCSTWGGGTTGIGGFGGGGGAGLCSGGGGGYSGGGSGTWASQGGGGGGGSMNNGINQSNTAGARSGHGYVTIVNYGF